MTLFDLDYLNWKCIIILKSKKVKVKNDFDKGCGYQMRISVYVANYILELLEENEDESVEIKRNELANTIRCV